MRNIQAKVWGFLGDGINIVQSEVGANVLGKNIVCLCQQDPPKRRYSAARTQGIVVRSSKLLKWKSYIHPYACVYVVCMYVCLYVCMYVCLYVSTYARMFVCMYVLCMYVCMYVCLYVCIYVHMHVHMFGCSYVRMFVYW
jgi:hypothetical protein